MNRKGIIQVAANVLFWRAVIRFVIGLFLFLFAHPRLVSIGLSTEMSTGIVLAVLLGLGIWSFKLPI